MATHGQDEALPARFGTLYPAGQAVAALRDEPAARAAFAALTRAGWPAADVTIIDGAAFLAHDAERVAEQNPLERLAGFLASDEAVVVDNFRELAEHGAWFVVVRADSDEMAAQVAASLDAIRPLAMHQYGANATREILRPDISREYNA